MDQVNLDARPSTVNQWSPAEIAVGCIAAVAAVTAVASVVFLALAFSEVIAASFTAVIVVGVVGLVVLLAAAVFLTVMKCCSKALGSTEEKLTPEDRHIRDQIKNLPNLLLDLSETISDENRLKVFQDRMKQDYPQDKDYVPQFKLDMERGVTFIVKDSSSEVGDLTPQLDDELNQDDKFEAGTKALRNFLKNENDRNWEKALQLVANQTSLNSLLDGPMMMFNISAASLQWDGENGNPYALKAVFSEELPPICLEIIRNQTTKEIETVQVKIEGSLDIISYNSSNNKEKKIRQKEAIKGDLTFVVKLNENHRPIISDLHSNLEANI